MVMVSVWYPPLAVHVHAITSKSNNTMRYTILGLAVLSVLPDANGYAFVARRPLTASASPVANKVSPRPSSSSSLRMIDDTILQGAGIAIAGLAAGIGLVAFTEQQGERAKERGGGLSDTMSTRIAGKLLEDVEVSSVSDVGSLTAQLEKALKESGGAKDEQFEMSEAEKKRITEDADDGW